MGIKIMFLHTFLVFATLFLLARAEPVEDKQALLDFVREIRYSRNLNWHEGTSVCNNWTGVTCNRDDTRVIALRLPAIGFKGTIPSNTLSRLSALQILSLRSNGIHGPFPFDLLKIGSLMGLYLQQNSLEGPLPLNLSVWTNLSVLNLANNGFSGSIPSSVANMTRLIALNLAHNSFSGDIPDVDIPSLRFVDLSNNNLSGVVPPSLSRFPSSAFSGNNISTENSSHPVSPAIAVPTPQSSSFSQSAILGIVIGSCAVVFVSIALLLVYINRKKKYEGKSATTAGQKKEKPLKRMVSDSRDGNTKLNFFEGSSLAFDLEDLLRASAEVLGKGTFGTTYKAALEDTNIVAVKRLKEVVVGKKDFEQQMEIFGSISHENVSPLRAYYYSKDEKLVVYDYHSWGSVSSLLHAKRGENRRIPLDWETRLRIAVGAARGINHIHSQNGGKLVHGNIKSSNIFLNSKQYGCVCDLGLATLMSSGASPMRQATGYRAPEVMDTRKASQQSDVYSFGVVLLELLTGKSPGNGSLGGEEALHLVRWVQSVVREEWTGEVFDVELFRYPDIEEEMVGLLQIGMSCVERMPEQRPKMGDVVKMVEEIRGSVYDYRGNNSPYDGTGSPGSSLTQY